MSVTETRVSETELDVVVLAAEEAADGVVRLTLGYADGRDLPPWTPGAHIDLELGDMVRQYSLCNSPADRNQWHVAILRAPDSRGGSVAAHDLKPETPVRVRGPRNHFPLVSSQRYIFIAGGIGITPILPMIEEAEAADSDWRLYYGGRSLESMAFQDVLAAYGDRVHLVPQDTAGILDLDTILGSPAANTAVYSCGPEPLLDAVEEHCQKWPSGALHLERFSAKQTDSSADESFEVVLQRSGRTVTIPPDKSIFEVVRGEGISVLGSCLEGVCGTCETEVLDGEVEHRDSVLSLEEQEENECLMICVSRARSASLTLDL